MTIRTALAIFVLSCTASAADVATASSPENLIKQVLSSLETKDEQGLKRLLITRDQFKKYIWPTLAANAGNVNAEALVQTRVRYDIVCARPHRCSPSGSGSERRVP